MDDTRREPDDEMAAARCGRQRAEIAALLACGRLHRAADLAHEHLAGFPEDAALRGSVIAALVASDDRRLHRRAEEFTGPDVPRGEPP